MSAVTYTKLIRCQDKDQYDILRIWQELLTFDESTQTYKIRTINEGSEVTGSIDCSTKDNYDLLRIFLEVVLIGSDGLLYLNIT